MPAANSATNSMIKKGLDHASSFVRKRHLRDLISAALVLRTVDVDGCTSAVASVTEGTLGVGNNYFVFDNAPWHECYPAYHFYNTVPNHTQLEETGYGIFRKINHTTVYVGGMDVDGDVMSALHAILEIPPTQRRRLLASRDGTEPDYSGINIVVDTEFANYVTK